MNRTSTTGLLLSMLSAAVGCGEDDFVCQLDVCGTGCVNLNADPLHCGQCFNECGTNEACEAGTCEPTELTCTAPEVVCGEACVDTQTSPDHCGTCDAPCTTNGDCVGGGCAEPLISLRTAFEGKGFAGRDLFVIQGLTLLATQLNTPTGFFDRVIDHAVLPDGRVLLVAAETEGVFELWLASPRGGTLTKLSGTLITDGGVREGLAVSADGTKVLYRAEQDVDNQVDLYAVSIANPGVTVKVNDALVSGGEVSRVFSLSMNGGRATYIADQDADQIFELYTVDLTQAAPGPSVKLNPALASVDDDVFDFTTTPDGSRVLYRGSETVPTFRAQLFVADVATAGTSKRIANTIEPDYTAIEDYSLNATGTAAIYTGGQSSFADSMYLSDLTVAAPDSVFLAENAVGFDAQVRRGKALVGGAVFFRQDVGTFTSRLFTVNVATPNVVTAVFDGTAMPLDVERVVVSPNGQHLVFGTGGDGGESGNINAGIDGSPFLGRSFELYHVDLTATLPAVPTRIVLSTNEGDGIQHDYIVRNDGSVIFRADIDTPGRNEVFVGNPALPDTSIKISPPIDDIEATDVDQIRSF